MICRRTPVCLTTYWQLWLCSLLLAYSVTDGCNSFVARFWWFITRPRGQPKWERGQHCTRPRPRPDTTRPRPRPKNLALRLCWSWGLNIPGQHLGLHHQIIKHPLAIIHTLGHTVRTSRHLAINETYATLVSVLSVFSWSSSVYIEGSEKDLNFVTDVACFC